MWDLRSRNRGILLLITVLTVCAVLYNAWGPILALTVSIILVIYVCYSLLTNDSILSPNTLIIVKYIEEYCREITASLNTASFHISATVRKFNRILYNKYRFHVASTMNRFRQNTYQLSNETRETSRNSSRFDLTSNQLSPISRNDYQENLTLDNHQIQNHYSSGSKLTSTPLAPFRKESYNVISNGSIGLYTPNVRPRSQETHINYAANHSSVRSNETVFSPEGSPWGTSISPKIRSKAAGVKTVQTVAGPLLASTRYNIDPKVYSDVTSPGLSSRLAKYATEANSKLTHQSQYATGQFPKVNLSASPLPLISAKNSKIRTPVTVRIAPPEASRYSPPERQKLLSDVCRSENRVAPSVVQVLREISLKRHASREDVSADLVKKQRTDGIFDGNIDNLEDFKQKRTREDSPNTEDEILGRNNQLRPVKKTKTPSCFDVLNSLSSSNQYSSGVKRKASTLDLSRSGTPDIEKHFKASESVQTLPKIPVIVTEEKTDVKKAQKDDLNEKSSPGMEIEVAKKLVEQPALRVKGILKSPTGNSTSVDRQQNSSLERRAKIVEDEPKEIEIAEKNPSPVINKPVNFTDKLFMKAEPQANERLRTMIQEQGNIRAKFTTDDVDEIKKEDIVNMRQTSMRARLQSMFDAISGKPAKKINPDVIIHAEGASEPNTAQTTPASLATLSSTTSTTNINTSPIATSAVAPTVADSKLKSTASTKHVTFDIPSSQPAVISQSILTGANSSTGIKTDTTQTVKLNSEAPKLSFGTLVSSSTTSPGSITPSFPSSQNANSNSAVPSTSNSNILPSSFVLPTSSTQISTQSLGTIQSSNVSTATNNSFNLIATTTTAAAKSFSPSSTVAFTLPNYSNATQTQNSNAVSSPKPATLLSSTIGTGNFTSESNKLIDSVKTSTEASVPMPNFGFSVPKPSTTVSSIFDGNNSSNNVKNQTATTAPTVSSATTSSFAPSSVMQTQQPAFGTPSTTGTIVSANTAATTASLFPFGGSPVVPQSTSTGSFSFTNTANAAKSQIPTFGSTTTQSTAAFGGAAAQNPPPQFNFQNIQSSGTGTTTSTQNPPLFGSNLSSNQNPPAFGSAVTTAQTASTFGNVASTAAAPPPSFGNTSTTSSSFAFGNTVAQTSATTGFGTNTNSVAPATVVSTSGTNPTFSFGSSTNSSTKSTGFAFGANTPATTASNTGVGVTGTSNQIPAFGATTASNVTPVFGAPSTTAPPAFGATSTSATPVFGALSGTTTSVFGTINTTTAPAFGNTASTAGPSLFGSPATTTTSTMFDTSNQSTFGSVSNSAAPGGFGTPKTTAPPAFGSHTNTESSFNYGSANSGGNNLFAVNNAANTSNTAATATTPSSAFGGNAVTKSVFGQTKPPPSFAASTSGSFGTGGATSSFGNQTPTFGANSSSVPAGNAPGFGSQTSATPAFGTQNTTAKQTPQGPPPAFGSTNSAFGSTTTAPPAFGANTATSSAFGSSTTNFGTQNSTAPPSFGASTGNPPPAFGASTGNPPPAFGANLTTAPFGGQSQTSPPAFGAQNSTTSSFGASNNNQTASFGFGANQTQTQQNSGFPFTGAAATTNNNATTATPFQFGSTAAKSEGFNFNASTTTPNMNFGATAAPPAFGTPTQGTNMFGTPSPAVPAGGMFSIGAGSTAPRSRSSRTRRQR